jgi:iron complex outermembrane receptor protein/hemoglobin/transferrin/lactoferrin receptor protein
VVVKARPTPTEPDRAASIVTRRDLDERLPRSAPDALRGEPGVYIQQTAHGQASPYIRGLTGQQTLLLYDGVRLNNSTFRQGPNQYFFTVDSRTIDRIEVIRGSASTRYGSDALGGAILASPLEPSLDVGKRKLVAHGRAGVRTATADSEVGGRGQLDLSYKGKLGLLGGIGYRHVGQLRAGKGVFETPEGQPERWVPRYGPDGRTQLGTGFEELTGDLRLVWKPRSNLRLTTAYYDYRQYDAPRTDRCPPPEALENECLKYNEQFRTLVYTKLATVRGPAAAEETTWTVSYQRQHEDRNQGRGFASPTLLDGVDNVNTVGTALAIATKTFALAPWADLRVRYGLDLYYDKIHSEATQTFTDVDVTEESPSQYSDGAQYLTSGVWGVVETRLTDVVRLRAGGRGGFVWAQADEIELRGSSAVDRKWISGSGHGGIGLQATDWLRFVLSVDQGFRVPNLDDLTSRQHIGPGFQFENARLRHERTTMFEGGIVIRHPWVELGAFGFYTLGRDFVQRASRNATDCPMGDPGCAGSRSRFQVVNIDRAEIFGADGALRLYLPYDLGLAATLSYARGTGDNPDAALPGMRARAPLSRVPPLNGTLEVGWRPTEWGVYLIGAMRWARAQRRLASQDLSDPRILPGGTPGFVVFDLRAGYRLDPHVLLGVVFENVGDTAWRSHGSSVYGAGRGLIVELQAGF